MSLNLNEWVQLLILKSMTNTVLSPNFVTFWPFCGLLIDQQPGPLFLGSISVEKKKKPTENVIWKLADVVLNGSFDPSWLLGHLCEALPQPWWLFMCLPTFCTAASCVPLPRAGTGTWLLTDAIQVHSQGNLLIPSRATGYSWDNNRSKFPMLTSSKRHSNVRFLKPSVEFLFRNRSGKGTIQCIGSISLTPSE